MGRLARVSWKDPAPDSSQPGIPELAGGDQSGLFGPLDLAVYRRMRGSCARRDLGKAEFKVRVAEEQRKYLRLLL
jgi:hypothetical protein